MRAPVSIVIPTLNSTEMLPKVLLSLMEGLTSGVVRELVFTDGGSTDPLPELAADVGANVVSGAAGRGGQLARGARAGQGEWLLFLHSDTELSTGWADVVMGHINGPDKAGYFRLAFDVKGFFPRFVAGWANLRSRIFGLPYGDQGLLVSRGLYDKIGGFKDMPLMEDVNIARRLKGQLILLNATATTSAARYQNSGWLYRGTRNLWCLMRYFAGADVERLAREYRR